MSLSRRGLLSFPLLGALFEEQLLADEAEPPALKKDPNDLKELLAAYRGLLEKVEKLEEKLSRLSQFNPPVGTVAAYLGAWPPKGTSLDAWEAKVGWMLCNGRAFDAKTCPELAAVLPGRALPNYVGRLARGAVAGEAVGAAGGADVVSFATVAAGGHVHSLPALTGTISNGGPNPGGKRYHVHDNNKGWRPDNWLSTEGKGNNRPEPEGQHYHDLGGNTGSEGAHAHQVNNLSIVPSYLAVHYIIKFRSKV
jgi:Phage Tail Collar Domain